MVSLRQENKFHVVGSSQKAIKSEFATLKVNDVKLKKEFKRVSTAKSKTLNQTRNAALNSSNVILSSTKSDMVFCPIKPGISSKVCINGLATDFSADTTVPASRQSD